MTRKIQFDDVRARTYRKRTEVLAFNSDGGVRFSKTWGEQDVRGGGWIIVPLSETGQPTTDVYGCDADVFAATYEPSPSLRPNRYRKKETVRAYQPGDAFEIDTVLADGHVEVVGSRSEPYDTWCVRAASGEMYPVEDAEFKRTYVEVMVPKGPYTPRSRDQHWASDGTPKRILALDGGGVRGILTLGYLERIEDLLRERHGGLDSFRLCDYFDLIAGTSTGAIIAACLAKGLTVGQVRSLYENLAGSVFKRSLFRSGIFRAKYGAKMIRKHLAAVFEKNTLGSKALKTGLLVVAKRLDTGSIWPMSNNPQNRFFTAGASDRFLSNEDYPLLSVVRASTAAPSYFAPEFIEISRDSRSPHGEFVDGGVSPHNNPALLALQLVTLNGFAARWPMDPDKLFLVSVGTGSARPGTSRSLAAGQHAIKSLRSVMDDCASLVEIMLQWLSSSPTARSVDAGMGDLSSDLLAERPLLQYVRYNVMLQGEWLREHLDKDLTDREITNLKEMDRPANMPVLSELGVKAAHRQVLESHFPKSFDLGA